MNTYILFTDSACDIKPALLKDWGVRSLSLSFRFENEDREYSNEDMEPAIFYDRMREGGIAKTAAINPEGFEKAFEEILKQGQDILYLGFSSGLSTTFHSAQIAAEELRERYPDRKILTVDTLAASAGQGLLLYLVSRQKEQGASIEDAAAYAEELRPRLCHWFTVNDLVYLKRGGRVSPTVAFVGNLLGIKPVLHVDDEGHLVSVSKARGRKAAVAALAEKYGELAATPGQGPIYISHSDCVEDAETLKAQLQAEYGAGVEIITDVGPVIGAHSGPGTLALFFVGTQR